MKQRGTSLPPCSHVKIFGTPMRMLTEDHLDQLFAQVNRIRNSQHEVPETIRIMREMCHMAEIRRIY